MNRERIVDRWINQSLMWIGMVVAVLFKFDLNSLWIIPLMWLLLELLIMLIKIPIKNSSYNLENQEENNTKSNKTNRES